MEDCVFCKIVDGKIPSNKVFENDEILAFKDINPATPIHILVIPKKHIKSINEIENKDEDLIGKIFAVIRDIAKEQGFADEGYRVISNCGINGGQEVPHLHFHIIGGKKLGDKIV